MSIRTDMEQLQSTLARVQYDAVVVGAGPYGLSTAAHLQGKGLNVAVFGKPLKLWRDHMPRGMFLRSHWWATNLSDPHKKYGFEQFFRISAYDRCYPVPIETFIDYALWFQKQAVPTIDTTYVSSIEEIGGQFSLLLEDGRTVLASAVIMALGLYYYANRPREYDHMPAELVTHSLAHNDFSRFAGKQVVVIGRGQSAVEYAALLHEVGASVHLVARHPIFWLAPDNDDPRSFLDQLRAPTAGIAPGWKNWGLEYMPYLFQRLPQARKDRSVANYTASASDWLRDRILGKVTLHEKQIVEKIRETDHGAVLALSDNTTLQADHVLLATGYRVDINRLPMLSPTLLSKIQTHQNVPLLNPWFESSIPGLYFTGITSIRSFGPLYRFVVGAKAVAPRIASAVARRTAANSH
ncbi:MAG TPA: NAD(P)-binding domain-containing protein [Ktedonobacteraceae bacterium]|nr:NAD(P)-binding domain-containing protein [Ktedonobacteraceae bacterium]